MKDNLTQKRERVFAHFGGSKTESGVYSQCLKITQNVASEFLNFGIFHQFLSYQN